MTTRKQRRRVFNRNGLSWKPPTHNTTPAASPVALVRRRAAENAAQGTCAGDFEKLRRLHFGEETPHFALQVLRLDRQRVRERLHVGGSRTGAGACARH